MKTKLVIGRDRKPVQLPTEHVEKAKEIANSKSLTIGIYLALLVDREYEIFNSERLTEAS